MEAARILDDLRVNFDVVFDAPIPTVREQIMENVYKVLRTGLPVTLKYDGRDVVTYFPDGAYQLHEWDS